jgi:hypothetical protein
MPFKKSSKRDELLKIVQTDPSIVREICVKYVPEMSTIKPELSKAANAWAKRTANLTHLAGALLKQMQVSMGNRRPQFAKTSYKYMITNKATGAYPGIF